MTETVSAKPSFRRVLSNKTFALLWLGQLVSQSGDYIFDVVALWLVLQLTGDVFKVGLTTATILLPSVIVGPIAGVYVDKYNRRDILLSSNIFQAIVVAGIAILYSLGSLSFPLLLGLLFLLNTGAQFVRPSVNVTIPRLVETDDLAAANSLFSISSSLNQIAGFGIGGIMILVLGIAVPVYYDSLTFVFAAGTVALISRSVLTPPAASPSSSSIVGVVGPVSFREKFVEGLQFIRTSRFLLELIALAIVINFFGGGVQTLIAPYSQKTIHGNSSTYGAVLAAFSLGTVLGAVAVGKMETRKYVGKLLFVGVLGTGGSIALVGFSTSALYALGLMLIVGVFIAIANLPLQVLIQAKVPGQMLGRVFTSLGALVSIAAPIAAVTTGSLATPLGVGPTLQLYGVCLVAVTLGGYIVFKEAREARY